MSGDEFLKPDDLPDSKPPTPKRTKSYNMKTSLEKIEEKSAICSGEHGDPMAVSKDGYVHREMRSGETDPPTTQLAHFNYFCPGLHGQNNRQDISRRTFEDILQEQVLYIIPIFQRRYCWENHLIHRWYQDTRRGKRDHFGIHNSGNLVVKWSQQDSGYILIDGQQRVTTTLLLLAALRDQIKAFDESAVASSTTASTAATAAVVEKLLRKISKLLLHQEGEQTNSKLVPCYMDRNSYYSILNGTTDSDPQSFQARAHRIFSQLIREDLSTLKTVEEKLTLLREIYIQSTQKMGATFVKILNDVDMAQVFLWLQEKGFGAGIMLANDSPGISLACCDLARNLILSPLLNLPIQEQERYYRNEWLEQLEQQFSDRQLFNAALKQYTDHRHRSIEQVSDFENTLNMSFKNSIPGESYAELSAYARFLSVFEAVKRARTEDSVPKDDVHRLLEVGRELIADMKTFFTQAHVKQ